MLSEKIREPLKWTHEFLPTAWALKIVLPNFETGIMKHRSFPIIFFKVIKNCQHWVELNTDAVKRHFLPPE